MTKLKAPFIGLSPSGTIAKAITFLKRSKHYIAEKKPELKDRHTPAQLSWRHMFQKSTDLWKALSAAEKEEWESLARPRHMTGYAWFVSQALRPNPGIYLPLQGGTMQGNIDMAKHRLLKLPLPTLDQEAASKKYHDDNLPPGGYTKGARVYNSASISIPNNTWTVLPFNSQRRDTDTIHDPVTNNSYLTCKTAGVYVIIGQASFTASAVGERHWQIRLNGITGIGYADTDAMAAGAPFFNPTTIYDLALNDYVELMVFQNSGGPLNIIYAPQKTPEFMMQRIG